MKMDRSRAMKTMKSIMMEIEHQYDGVEHKSISEWVYTYKVGEDLPDLEVSMEFKDLFIDIFIRPNTVILKEENLVHMYRVLNFMNKYLKGSSRIYIDGELNVEISLRFTYKQLELLEFECVPEIQFILTIYKELIDVLRDVGLEGMHFVEAVMETEFRLIELEERGYKSRR